MKKIVQIVSFIFITFMLMGCSSDEVVTDINDADTIIATKNDVNDYVKTEVYYFEFDDELCDEIGVKIVYTSSEVAEKNYDDYKENASTKGMKKIKLKDKTITYELISSDYLNNYKSNIVDILLENDYYISYK